MQLKTFPRKEVPSADPTWERCTWGLPNIVYFAKDRGDPPEQLGMPTILRDAVLAVAKAKPRWTLYISSFGYGRDNARLGNGVIVCQGKEVLGFCGYDPYGRGGNPNIFMNSYALDKKLQKRDATKTGDAKRATALILKGFTSTPVLEQMKDRLNDVQSVVWRNASTAAYQLSKNTEALYKYVKQGLREDNEALRAVLLQLGASQDKLDTMADFIRADHEGQRMSTQQSKNEGTYIFTDPDGAYLVVRYDKPEGQQWVRHNSMTLPDHLRGPLGMLKLVDDSTVVDGIGAKLNGTTFFIMD